MVVIRSDLNDFAGRKILLQQFALLVKMGRRITVTDDILLQYFQSVRVAEQYPQKIHTAAHPTVALDILKGLLTSVET